MTEGSTKKRCVMVMYDTLCRHFMPSYGNEWVKAPNFRRLAKRTVQFDNFYVGSMPCMPARREMHTGRYNFLHRSWGPLEPFDDSMPELLDQQGVHSHKVTDHHHYWEDGGATYHQRYTTFDLVRGQEGDKWVGDVEKLRDPSFGADRWPEIQRLPMPKQDMINREHMTRAKLQPQHITFDLGLEFIDRNKDADRWFLQIETFDPHEPFFSQEEFQRLYPHEYGGPPFDWPPYRELREDQQTVEHIRYMYASLVSFCDQQLGRVLDVFDEHNLWQDTLLLVNTDHGFLMGEHDWWA
ncbi:MAG: sulfatase, partial [Pseudomonadota bacterium]|nr:sulfatase [Pseudomonadota bacterium]